MIVLHHSSSMSRGWPGEITMLWWSYLLWSSYNKENAQESTWGSKHHQAGHLIFSDVQKNKKVTYFDIRPKNVRIASCQFRIRKFLYEVPWVFSNGCIEVLHPFKNSAAERVASLWATLSFSMGGLDRDSRGLLAEREREKRPLADTDLAQYSCHLLLKSGIDYLQSVLLTLSFYVELDFRWWKYILVFRKRLLTTVESRFRKVRKKGRGWSKYEKK